MKARSVFLVVLTVAVPSLSVGLRGPTSDAGPTPPYAGPTPYAAGDAAPPVPLRVETLASGLDTPWDLAWGPDGAIWVTERPGRISRVDPSTGEVNEVGRIDVVEVSESGLMGMAFHPDFEREPYVYFAHSYGTRSSVRNRLVRMRFDGDRLGDPDVLLNDIPGARNHDGSRLTIGPDGFLYMTTGDAGRRGLAQDLESLAGKILRLRLDGRPAPGNPFGSLIYSYGHRNPQGLAFHPTTGILYSAEHGPGDNDEVNRIRIGGNYGWPAVHGFCDGETSAEEDFCRDHDVQEAMSAWTPTVGLSGLAVYESDLIPGWKGSLLVTSLRGSTLFRLTLSADGGRVTTREALFAREYGRLRDVLVGPGGEVYLATSNHDGRGRPASDDDRILKISP